MPSIHHPQQSGSGNLRRLQKAVYLCFRDDVMGGCFGAQREPKKGRRYLDLKVGDAVGEATNKVLGGLGPTGAGRHILPVPVARGMPLQKPELCDVDVQILKESWPYMKRDLYYICKDMFCRILVDFPRVFDMFHKAVQYDALLTLESFATGHAQRIVFTVEKVIGHLGSENDKWVGYLYAVGLRHGESTVRYEYMDFFVPYFVHALRSHTAPELVLSIEPAWVKLFNVVIYHLKDALIF